MSRSILIFAFCSGLTVTAWAGDPTAPPAGFVAPVSAGDGGVADGGGAPSRLQSVIVRPNRKSLALIDGQTYALGDKVGEMKLVRIGERSVLLQGPQGKEELFLIPDVAVTPVQVRPVKPRSNQL